MIQAALHQDWHAWVAEDQYLLSDESTKTLRAFGSKDELINWLYLNDHKEAARYFNKEFV